MILTPYIIGLHEPIKMRYMKLRESPFVSPSAPRDHVLTLDILEKESILHILLGRPDWNRRGLSNDIENICSSLLMLMDLCGLMKTRDQILWYELSLFSFPEIDLQALHFKDDGQFLSGPAWKSLSPEDSPFNLSNLTVSKVIPLTKEA
ncbi:MAG: hypothetical protein BGO67_03610 [Alphaproteobacteria bacterium 41-28]|nr:MAG: hypothetical protein BGO67_03610 [Alphaproteobacteria bacterium 41-28]